MAQFANAFAHVPENNEGAAAAPAGGAGAYSPPPTPPPVHRLPHDRNRWARSPSPYRMRGYRGESPLPPAPRLANPPNLFRMVEEARREEARRAVNAELRRMRALVPNAYEEDGIIVIPPAAQRLAAPAPLRAAAAAAPLRAAAPAPQIRATGPPAPEEPDNPRPLNNNNNNNNVNPQPRRNQRRRTRRRASRQRRLRR